MGQDRESGAAGRTYGLNMGRRIAELLGAVKVRANSNEVTWASRRAVIKAAKPKNDSIGVTAAMLPRLDDIYGAFEDENGNVDLWKIAPALFERLSRDSPSARNRGTDTRLVRKRDILEQGTLVRRFSKGELAG
jgi:hypothetical protein